MTDTIQINPDLRILSYVSSQWTECYTQHLQNITLTVSLSFHLLKRRSGKLTHSVTATLSYVLSIPWFLPLEVSPAQFLLGAVAAGLQGRHKTKKLWGSQDLEGLGLNSVCVYRSWNTHTPQPQGNQSNVHEGNLPQKTSFPLDFLLFLSCFFFCIIQ